MNDFTEAMAARSDAQLFEIATAGDGVWREEALSAAHAELARRKLPIPTREEVVQTRVAVDAARANVPLEVIWILGAIGLPLFVFPWFMMAGTFERQGYLRKAKTLRSISSVMVFVFYTPIVIAIVRRMLR